MKLCFLVDARSPIAQNWIEHFIRRGYEVHVISSYRCRTDTLPGATVHQFPIAFSQLSRISHNGTFASQKRRSLVSRGLASLRTGTLSRFSQEAFSWLGPLEVTRHVEAAHDLIRQIAPDMVHAMRIPFEGILAAKATPPEIPLLVSVWGNDFTLFASRNPLLARQTRACLERADALHCDCQRDLDLAMHSWSFQANKPAAVLPGAGGIQSSLFYPGKADVALRRRLNISDDASVIINPRGFRPYVRNDIFFQAVPIVLSAFPQVVFICTGMQGSPVAERWVRRLGIEKSVRLLPSVQRHEMAELFRLAWVTVSPSIHDGTPNTLLEAMACGCFPVAGDIESVREWITNGVNGLLCDPTDAGSLARALIRAVGDGQLREAARQHNACLIAERADYDKVMKQAEALYSTLCRTCLPSVCV
jgi:glycosyltransferase involved in cell wall biosynthesis